MRIGFLHSILRADEKYLLEEFRSRSNVELEKLDDRELIFTLDRKAHNYDVVIERCISHSRALYALRCFQEFGTPTVNSYDTANICGDKIITNLALEEHHIPTPRARVAFTPETALKAIDELGYPVVMKPTVGSWGRLLAKLNDREAAEAVLEHKEVLGSYIHSVFYIQEYMPKPGRDIRAFVVGDQTIAAVYRNSLHWITNTAKGGTTSKCEITDELNDLCVRAANACGGGVLALDVFETKDGLKVNEVNYTMEFKNSIAPTGVDIPKHIVDYVLEAAK